MPAWIQESWKTFYSFIAQTVMVAFPLVNAILVIMAACFGSMLYGKIKPRHGDVLLKALGIFVMMMGVSYAWDSFFVLQTGQFETTGTLLVLFSLLLGFLFGEAFSIDRGIARLGAWLASLFSKKEPPAAKGKAAPAPAIPAKVATPGVEGFVLAFMICAVSATSLRCTLDAQMVEEPAPLFIKLGFDIIVIFLLAALFGSAVTAVAAPMLAFEGLLIALYSLWGDFFTVTLIDQLVLVGAVILIATGLGMGLGKKLRTANLLPAFLIPFVYGLILLIVTKATEGK